MRGFFIFNQTTNNKQMAKTPHLQRHPNAVVFRNTNRRISAIKSKVKDKKSTTLHFTAMTSEVGKEPGVRHGLHRNDKVKHSEIGLTDAAIVDLYHALRYYIKDVLKK